MEISLGKRGMRWQMCSNIESQGVRSLLESTVFSQCLVSKKFRRRSLILVPDFCPGVNSVTVDERVEVIEFVTESPVKYTG